MWSWMDMVVGGGRWADVGGFRYPRADVYGPRFLVSPPVQCMIDESMSLHEAILVSY